MIDWIRKTFFPRADRPAAPVSTAKRSRVQATYDASKTVDDNSRHWANTDSLSADAAHSPAVRKLLRERARYECQENNSYGKGIVLTLANDTIGTGPRLQMQGDNGESNKQIERAWWAWSRQATLAEKLRTMRIAKVVDGESFALLTTNRLYETIQLDIKLIEADQVTTPWFDASQANAVDGIVFDTDGNPSIYHVLKSHPGGNSFGAASLDVDRVSASKVIHAFRCDRPGQVRGVPEVASALPLFSQLRRFTLATIAAAETAADFAGVMFTDSPALEAPDDVIAMEAVELERRAMLSLPAGWKMGQMKAEHPTITYDMFVRAILKEIARCLNMPYNVAAGDSSDYNYASGRLDHQTYFRAIRVEQQYFETVVLDRIFSEWVREFAAIQSGIAPSDVNVSLFPHGWFWDGTEHVDPLKEAKAAIELRDAGLLTDAEYFARRGFDWEDQHEQMAREAESRESRGLPPVGMAMAVASEDVEEDE